MQSLNVSLISHFVHEHKSCQFPEEALQKDFTNNTLPTMESQKGEITFRKEYLKVQRRNQELKRPGFEVLKRRPGSYLGQGGLISMQFCLTF